MFALSIDTAPEYLRSRGVETAGARITELGGGVSNTVLLVEGDGQRFILKQALGKLRVEDDWFSDPARIFRESAALGWAAAHLPPGGVPGILFEDRENLLFAMTAAPAGALTWKSLLMQGQFDTGTAECVARMLAAMVRASWHDAESERQFGDQTVFDQLRLDPYYRTTTARHPDLAPYFDRLMRESAARRVSLVHGDWSPKNFLVSQHAVMAIDFEVVHFGDPAFDTAFLLNHLLLKSIYRPLWRRELTGLALRFWEVYCSGIPSDADWIEGATVAHLGCLLLARIDGKSPVEYITNPELRERIRGFARHLIVEPPPRISDVFEYVQFWQNEILSPGLVRMVTVLQQNRLELKQMTNQTTEMPGASVTIRDLRAFEILDSRGDPTVMVEAELSDGTIASAKVPSGASTGTHEARELRDGDPLRYGGKGVRQAVENVQVVLAPALRGRCADDQAALDLRMIELDATPDKSRLGANAILGVSCAVARAVAKSRGIALWKYLAGGRRAVIPVPMVNILSGGLHAGHNFEVQDFLAVPLNFPAYAEALRAVVAVHRAARAVLEKRGCMLTGVADEGGWGPHLASNETALAVMVEAIEAAGYRPAEQIAIAIDVAASHFYHGGKYDLQSERRWLTSEEMISLLAGWAGRYPIISIEDALAEDDWDAWCDLTATLGAKMQLIGDDLFVTNPSRLERGIRERAANAVLVKMNQIGTLTETFQVIDRAREAGFRAVISARSGETEDDFLADLAVASGAGQIKVGSITRSERLAKYNRLLEIESSGGLSYAASLI